MRPDRAILSVCACLCTGLWACQLILGIEHEGVPRGPSAKEAGADASACILRHPPGPPSADKVITKGGSQTLTFAARTLSFGQAGTPPVGYDLDDRCTGVPGPAGDAPCRSSSPSLDADGGIDNALFTTFGTASVLGSGDPLGDSTTKNVSNGEATQLITVFDYNGEDNDDAIRFDAIGSPGLLKAGCEGADVNLGPKWDGCDQWAHLPTPQVTADGSQWSPPTREPNGYVVDRRLVVNVHELILSVSTGEITLRDVIVTALIERTGPSTFRLLDGLVSGRAVVPDLLRSSARLITDSQRDCIEPATATLIRLGLCGARDLPLRREDDHHDLACDALSMAMTFEALTARIGAVASHPPPRVCPPSDETCP